ncbi:menaquinone biosynthesis family protein [Fimbriimonas ginsengisoli]|uniref:1,4-dihydroxy-6-naphtoate synthase n=1 Tax=Fimbriimonas ginsengisoli Gsoil 348 TaxID=661478 RepID=A0A068NXQ2_FIMGI|nr:MqnA/MqnD/SBP family protein [Fimbriimonas ginsengisoli]AIE87535.1 Menaquinone via futalosine step 4 [Fimbriimonas ginsengisoli Gsoil 348]
MLKIRLGHSPDSDDAFMFWGLASGEVKTDYDFEHILRDIQTLNEWAMEGKLESTAISVHAFAHVSDKYALLRHGGSFGDEYGPMIVAKRALSPEELRETVIAIPGKMTSAFLALNLYFEDQFGAGVRPKTEVVPFDEIIPAIQEGKYEAGLIIHEGQLTYEREGMTLIADMGRWWKAKTGLPLPLGVNVVRKDLGDGAVKEVSRCMRESIHAGLSNRGKALDYALQFARGMDTPTSDEFVGMYVNERTLDMGDEGIRAIRLFLQKGTEAGIVPPVQVDVVD